MTLRSRLGKIHDQLVPPASEQSWTAYLWLVYLSFFSIEWFFRPVGAIELGLIVLTLAVFLTLYFSTFRRKGTVALVHILAIASLGVAWSAFNAGASVFFVYAAAFAYQVGPPRHSWLVVAGVAALAALTATIIQPVLAYWIPGAVVSVIIGAANIYFGEQTRRNAELRLSQVEVRRLARVAERERIARDLHDVLGHTLSVIAVKSELAGRLIASDPQRAGEEIRSVQDTARRALADVRDAISGFRHQCLDEVIENVRSGLRAADVELELEIDDAIVLSPQRESMLALVVREAATNIIRHARARHCRIVLQRSGNHGEVTLDITDDGNGRIRPEGAGVQGMSARIEALGGRLRIESESGGRLSAWLPGEPA